MFIGYYEDSNGNEYFNNLYYKNSNGYREWFKDSFSPMTENVRVLDFKIQGNNYQEKRAYLEDLAIDWSTFFAGLDWSYSELAEIQNWFYTNGKRYGLLKEFKENCIC